MDEIFFTVVDPISEGLENRIYIDINKEDGFATVAGTSIDAQQLAELGILLFAIANQIGKPDLDSCNELLDGYNIPLPKNALMEVATDA